MASGFSCIVVTESRAFRLVCQKLLAGDRSSSLLCGDMSVLEDVSRSTERRYNDGVAINIAWTSNISKTTNHVTADKISQTHSRAPSAVVRLQDNLGFRRCRKESQQLHLGGEIR